MPEDLPAATPNALRRLVAVWTKRDWVQVGALLAVIATLHIVGFGTLLMFVAPQPLPGRGGRGFSESDWA